VAEDRHVGIGDVPVGHTATPTVAEVVFGQGIVFPQLTGCDVHHHPCHIKQRSFRQPSNEVAFQNLRCGRNLAAQRAFEHGLTPVVDADLIVLGKAPVEVLRGIAQALFEGRDEGFGCRGQLQSAARQEKIVGSRCLCTSMVWPFFWVVTRRTHPSGKNERSSVASSNLAWRVRKV